MATRIGTWTVRAAWDSEGEECVLQVREGAHDECRLDDSEFLFYVLRDDAPDMVEAMFMQLPPRVRIDLINKLCAHLDPNAEY